MVTIKTRREIELMKEACKITAEAHLAVEKALKVGMTTKELDKIAEDVIKRNGAVPSFKDYPSGFRGIKNFPATTCISVNEQVIHGIPSDKVVIADGDVVSIDLGAYINGFHGDSARTYLVGNGSKKAQKLIDVTKQSFFEGIKYALVGNRISDISYAIGEYVAKNGYNVVREFQGHGIGRNLHEDPGIPNYGTKNKGIRLESGMTLAIEPMVNMGTWEVKVLGDGWTTITADGSLSAHYENTILITEKTPEILTMI